MEDATVFKGAVTTPSEVTGSAEPTLDPSTGDALPSGSNLPPSLYAEANRPPLVLEALGLIPYMEKFDTSLLGSEINHFIISEIQRQHLKDDVTTYKQLLENYEKKLHLDQVDDPFIKLEKIAQYASVQQKLLEAVREREELLQADIMDLSGPRLRKYMELHYGT